MICQLDIMGDENTNDIKALVVGFLALKDFVARVLEMESTVHTLHNQISNLLTWQSEADPTSNKRKSQLEKLIPLNKSAANLQQSRADVDECLDYSVTKNAFEQWVAAERQGGRKFFDVRGGGGVAGAP